MRPWTRCWPSLSLGLIKIICALGNICLSETPNKESFFHNAKFYKIGIWILWLFHNNLGISQEFFGQVIHSLFPPPQALREILKSNSKSAGGIRALVSKVHALLMWHVLPSSSGENRELLTDVQDLEQNQSDFKYEATMVRISALG